MIIDSIILTYFRLSTQISIGGNLNDSNLNLRLKPILFQLN